MKFNRLALIKAAEDEMLAGRARNQDRADIENTKRAAAADEWVAANRELWLAALPKLRAKLKADKPLYQTDFPRTEGGRFNSSVYGDRPMPPEQPATYNDRDLGNLVATLKAISDDEVTPSGMAAIGITSSALRGAIQRLGRSTSEA